MSELKRSRFNPMRYDCQSILDWLENDTDGKGYGSIYSLGYMGSELPYTPLDRDELSQEQLNCGTIYNQIKELKSNLKIVIGKA